MCCEAPLRLCVHFLELCDLPETSKKIRNFFPHSGTVEANN